MRARLDPISAIESCYGPAAEEGGWLEGLLGALRPLDQGLGLYSFSFALRPAGLILQAVRVTGKVADPAMLHEATKSWQGAPPDVLRAMFAPAPPVDFSIRRAARISLDAARAVAETYRRSGARDCLGIMAAEPEGGGVLVGVQIPRGRAAPAAPTRRVLAGVAAHLSTALRLRRAAGSTSPGDPSTEAILDPSARVQHAEGEARPAASRASLAEAVQHRERARGKLRRADPEEAVGLWRGLVDGTWSLVDFHESDGRRLVLARRNPPRVEDPAALRPRERQVLAFARLGHSNKYIAYLLGLATGTVSAHLESARRKLRLPSRAALIQVYGGSPAGGSNGATGAREPGLAPPEPRDRGS